MPKPTPPTAYLTPEEVAERLRTTPLVIVRACRAKELRATKPNKSWLITEDDLADYIARNYNREQVAS